MKILCQFNDILYHTNEKYYGCEVNDQRIPEGEVLEFVGQHKNGKSNNDVIEVFFYNCTITKVPRGLSRIFPNMKILDIWQSKLQNLTKYDLAEYKSLKRFLCASNPVEFLPGDLFEGFGQLEWIRFRDNKLEVIEPNILDGLNSLKYVNFANNPNYDKFFTIYGDTFKPNATLQQVKEQLFEKFFDASPFYVKRYVKSIQNKLQAEKQYKREADRKIQFLTNENKLLAQEVEEFKSNSIFIDLKNHIQDESFKDFKILIDGEDISVHKFFLAARSSTLAEMLRNEPEAEDWVLVDIPVNVFKQILNFIYTDELPRNHGTNFYHIFAAASRLKIRKLTDFAASKILENINSNNALEILDLGNKYEHDGLRKSAFTEIRKKYPNFVFKDELAMDTTKVIKMIDFFKQIKTMEKKFSNLMEQK